MIGEERDTRDLRIKMTGNKVQYTLIGTDPASPTPVGWLLVDLELMVTVEA